MKNQFEIVARAAYIIRRAAKTGDEHTGAREWETMPQSVRERVVGAATNACLYPPPPEKVRNPSEFLFEAASVAVYTAINEICDQLADQLADQMGRSDGK